MPKQLFIMWGPKTPAIEMLYDEIEALALAARPPLTCRLISGDAGRNQGSFFKEVAEFSAAPLFGIALIGPDVGASTNRGNVWMEWAYIIALHSDHHLLTVFVGAKKPNAKDVNYAGEYGSFGEDFLFIKESQVTDTSKKRIAKKILKQACEMSEVQVEL